MNEPKALQFSIIIPYLNSLGVKQLIESLEMQDLDHSKFEVIIVGMDSIGLIKENNFIHYDRSEIPLSPAKARTEEQPRQEEAFWYLSMRIA